MNLFSWFRMPVSLRHLAALGRAMARPPRSPVGRRARRQLQIETLEDRINMAAEFRTFDGTGNNLTNADWGAAEVDLLRKAAAQYADGVSAPAGADRPSAREISNLVSAHPDEALTNNLDWAAFVYAWGQFLDHDLDLTVSASPKESFNVAVPTGDVWFDPTATGTQQIRLSRSEYDSATGLSAANPRQQINSVTAFIDGSQIYGSDAERAAALRTFAGGRMKTSDGDMLPFNTLGLANANDAHLVPDDQLYVAGDVRANENIELLALHTLFVREHNRLADQFAAAHPDWSDETLYQQARRTVIAELQVITYREFLPTLIGPNALRQYSGYKANVNPGISNEFSTAAFRLGHSMLGDDIEFLDNDGNEILPAVGLREAFFNPALVGQSGIDPILKYLASDQAEEIDTKVVDDVRNFLFGPPGAGGFDLVSLNIQRGRDHGLPDYNSLRAAYGLPKVKSFAQITPDRELQQQLEELYGSVDKIDAWVGGLAEKHVPGGGLGPLFTRILADQFTRLRDGDRFWYQREFSKTEVRELEKTTLADVIRRNTELTNLQDNVFIFRTTIGGTVFDDRNQDAGRQRNERGLPGVTVQLLDDEGNIVATTLTDSRGLYRFDDLELGVYRVQEQTPSGAKLTTAATIEVSLTRGMDVRAVDFGLTRAEAAPAPAKPNGPVGPRPPAPPPIMRQTVEQSNAADRDLAASVSELNRERPERGATETEHRLRKR